ncbi:AAA family ATPase [Halomicroarcula sp. GCM10025709]|uniref:AAA family ATPase n=1 Tax=Haloarcula TaxID=2237 RepID=UPI0024C44A0D|nr:AAA family ATPase [Halomicroarcula sp. YJ-61-S]
MDSPVLIAFCGLPGVGKSTASGYAARQCEASRYRSDEVRKSLFEDPSYTDAEIERTYEELLSQARAELERGESVVVDATFNSTAYREMAAETARSTGAELLFVRVTCSREVVRERIRAREGSVSDADFAVYEEHRAAFDPFERDHVVVDNSETVEATHDQIDRQVVGAVRETVQQ